MHRWVFDRRAGISIIFILYTQSVQNTLTDLVVKVVEQFGVMGSAQKDQAVGKVHPLPGCEDLKWYYCLNAAELSTTDS